MKMHGLCSVIMPVYNSEKYIAHAIESVLAQTYTNIELIIIDDYSADNTKNIISRYADKDARIKLLCNPQNIGCAASRNKGLDFCNGEYIAFIDSDDIWLPTKLEKQISFMDLNNLNMSYTAYDIINSDGLVKKHRYMKEKLVLADLLKENSVIFSTTVFKAFSVKGIGFQGQWVHEDYVFLLDYLKKYSFISGLNESLVKYRVHSKGRSFNKVKAAKFRWKIYREYLNFNLFRASIYFIVYAVKGFIKYS